MRSKRRKIRVNRNQEKAADFISSLKLVDAFWPQEKVVCPQCKSRRKYFCWKCLRLLPGTSPPEIRLPVSISIVIHPHEKRTKASSLQAVVLAPKDVTLHTFPDDVPAKVLGESGTYLVFPGEGVPTVGQLAAQHGGVCPVRRAVVVESTWQQTAGVLRHPVLAALPRVQLDTHDTVFWRYQDVRGFSSKTSGDESKGLATLEAIYYVCREIMEEKSLRAAASPAATVPASTADDSTTAGAATATTTSPLYDGSIDNLLAFYADTWRVIQGAYAARGRSFHRIPGWEE